MLIDKKFVDDMMCVMDHAGAHAGVCMGNDFGAQVCWEAGRSRPDRFIGVFNAVVPYVSSAFDFVPTEKLVEIAPGFGYQLYLSNNATGGAAELDADPRGGIRSCAQVATTKVPKNFLKDQTSFLQAWREDNAKNNRTEIPFSGIMSKKVEDYMVKSYQKQGYYNSKSCAQFNSIFTKLTKDSQHSTATSAETAMTLGDLSVPRVTTLCLSPPSLCIPPATLLLTGRWLPLPWVLLTS